MMYRVMDGDGPELTAMEVAMLAMPNIDDDACADLRMGFTEWLFDHMDPFDAVMGRLNPLDMMARYVDYLGRTSDEDLDQQFGVSVVRKARR